MKVFFLRRAFGGPGIVTEQNQNIYSPRRNNQSRKKDGSIAPFRQRVCDPCVVPLVSLYAPGKSVWWVNGRLWVNVPAPVSSDAEGSLLEVARGLPFLRRPKHNKAFMTQDISVASLWRRGGIMTVKNISCSRGLGVEKDPFKI